MTHILFNIYGLVIHFYLIIYFTISTIDIAQLHIFKLILPNICQISDYDIMINKNKLPYNYRKYKHSSYLFIYLYSPIKSFGKENNFLIMNTQSLTCNITKYAHELK